MKPDLFVVAGGILAAIALVGAWRDPSAIALADALQAPSSALPFGTDHLGRDMLARVAHATFRDLRLGIATVVLAGSFGIVAGLVMAEFGGAADKALGALADTTVTLPSLVIAVILAQISGGGEVATVLALAATLWVKFARIARAQALVVREAGFARAARALGAPRVRLLRVHILPNILPPLAALAALQFAHTVLGIAALGFLGLGVPPPAPEWGTMIAEARPYIARAPWIAVMPGIALVLAALAALGLARRIAPAAR